MMALTIISHFLKLLVSLSRKQVGLAMRSLLTGCHFELHGQPKRHRKFEIRNLLEVRSIHASLRHVSIFKCCPGSRWTWIIFSISTQSLEAK